MTNADFKQFLQYVSPVLKSDLGASVSSTKLSKVKDFAVKRLGVSSINALRDRHEGLPYLHTLNMKTASVLTIESIFDIELIKWDQFEDRKYDVGEIEIDGVEYSVVPFEFGTLPMVDISLEKNYVFCCLKNDMKIGYFCGYLTKEDLSNEKLFLKSFRSINKNQKKFIGFNDLKTKILKAAI